jgi:hypothetical protein
VNAAEILRYTWGGWSNANITRFSNMINNLFVPAAQVQGLAVFPFSGNWGTSGEKALIAYGVFLNNRTIYDLALDYYITGGPNGEADCGKLSYMIPTTTGQYIESGRDQGHSQFSLGNSTFQIPTLLYFILIILFLSGRDISSCALPGGSFYL